MKKFKYIFLVISIVLFGTDYYLKYRENVIQERLVDEYIQSVDNNFMALIIPKIELKTIVSLKEDLNKVSLFGNSFLPNKTGNVSLIAHSGNSYKSFFRNIDDLSFDDEIYLYYDGFKYKYLVDDIYNVYSDDLSSFDNGDFKEITLVTCTENPNERLIVKGRYVQN